MTEYEAVIGLEVHCELATATKLFCGCRNSFGDEANTNVCPVCLGLPGSLPVLNRAAVEYALRFAEALHFDVPERSIFARKNYFYPDMPKDYQVSQYEDPILVDGVLEIDGVRIGIERAHLEEDTGKTTHIGGGGRIHDADSSLVDYNRAGVPLMEIVSRPDLRNAEQARSYVTELRRVLKDIGVSDVKMEEGSLRVDANVSVRAVGTEAFGTKVEVKNMNSVRSLGRAIEHEIERQIGALGAGERIVQETRHWDEESGNTSSMRVKEGSSDYRYFPEPDLVPVAPTDEQRAAARAARRELPAERRDRFIADYGAAPQDAELLADDDDLARYAVHTATAVATITNGPSEACKWVAGEFRTALGELGSDRTPLLESMPDRVADLVRLVLGGALSATQAKDVLRESLATGKRPADVVADRGLTQVSDESELAAVIDGILAAHAGVIEEYRAGDALERKKKRGFLMGEAMKATRGSGNPALLNRLLDERLR